MAYVWRGAPSLADTETPAAPTAVRDSSTPGPKPKLLVFDPSRCGTVAGYKRHEKTRTPKCQPCKDANADYSRDYEARVKLGTVRRGFRPDACGTRAGHRRHQRAGVPSCGPCRAANAAYAKQLRIDRKAAA